MSLYTLLSEWKVPLYLAVGFHLFILVCAMVLPGLMGQRTILPEFTTINMVNIEGPAAKNEPAASAPKQVAAPPAPPKPAETIKPEVTKQIPPPVEAPAPDPVPVPEPVAAPEPAAPPAPAEAISIKPLKQKLKKEIKEIPDTRAEDARIRKDELKNITRKLQEEARQEVKKEEAAQETIRQQRQLAAAREEANRAEIEARMAAADAKNALQEQIRASSSASTSAASSHQSGASNAQSMGVLEQQYYATIMGHIQQHWLPPDVKTWAPNLLAVVGITIAGDGQIVSQLFEQESGDKLFDQFVLKTLEAANPLPAPPPALQKQRLEVGLRFKPSGIQ
ncbi:MAG: cell envelope integrity protein TolA [Desulfobulbaceae bacterium]